MATPQIWEQFSTIHEHIREKVEQHFNKDLEYRKYAVCNLRSSAKTEYACRLGDTVYHPLFTDATFDVKLADLTNVVSGIFDWAISCTVRIQTTGELYIDNILYSGKVTL